MQGLSVTPKMLMGNTERIGQDSMSGMGSYFGQLFWPQDSSSISFQSISKSSQQVWHETSVHFQLGCGPFYKSATCFAKQIIAERKPKQMCMIFYFLFFFITKQKVACSFRLRRSQTRKAGQRQQASPVRRQKWNFISKFSKIYCHFGTLEVNKQD